MASPISVRVTLSNNKGTWTARGDYIDPISGRRERPSRTLRLKVAKNTKRKALAMLPQAKEEIEAEVNARI